LPSCSGREALFTACDVRDYDQIEACVDFIQTHFGRLDALVNNAGGAPHAEAATASPRYSEAIIRLNLIAPLNVSQVANRLMQTQAEVGSIINIASVSTLRPSPGTAAYGAAKAGLVNLGASLAVEWAPRVRVNAVIAGLTQTEQSDLHYGDAAGIAAVAATIPLGRMGLPADIGNACLFLGLLREWDQFCRAWRRREACFPRSCQRAPLSGEAPAIRLAAKPAAPVVAPRYRGILQS